MLDIWEDGGYVNLRLWVAKRNITSNSDLGSEFLSSPFAVLWIFRIYNFFLNVIKSIKQKLRRSLNTHICNIVLGPSPDI